MFHNMNSRPIRANAGKDKTTMIQEELCTANYNQWKVDEDLSGLFRVSRPAFTWKH
jgi:hypothetical protein